VARSAILLEPHVIGIHIIHFRPQEVAYHRFVALAVYGCGNARFVLEEVRTDDFARPHQTDFLEMHLELVYLAWIGIVPNSTILLVHISIHPKMDLIAKDDLFGEIWVNFQLLQNPRNEHTALSMVVYLSKVPGSVEFYKGADPSSDAKFAKLKSQKGQILVNDEKLTASGFPVHSHAQQRCFQETLRFGDVLVLADYLLNRLTRIWPPNVE